MSPKWRKSSYSGNAGNSCVEISMNWRKSSKSGNNGNSCVELAPMNTATAVRDSKNPTGPVLAFTSRQMTGFLAAAKGGVFDR